MTKKFFSLIHGDQVRIAPETKVIAKEAISTIATAEEILQRVQEDAKLYRTEVTTECEAIKEKAFQEGFEEGFSQWSNHLAELETAIIQVRGEFEQVLAPVALKAAQKIVGRELESSKNTVVDIVANSLKSVAQHKKITIYVNPDDFDTVDHKREHLKEIFENLESLSIQPKEDVTVGGCIIETERGIINAQLENKWIILENAFKKLIKHPLPEEPQIVSDQEEPVEQTKEEEQENKKEE